MPTVVVALRLRINGGGTPLLHPEPDAAERETPPCACLIQGAAGAIAAPR